MKNLSDFQKTKDYLICVDSDGCAMDTMDIKHIRCFGPCMVTEWNLKKWRDEILARWNAVNLYTMTRGINRFKGLAIALAEVNKRFCPIEGVEDLIYWAENSDELSNDALSRQIQATPDKTIFQKALSWSRAVNAAIRELPEAQIKPFDGVAQALAFAHKRADVAIVSSANPGAVLEEWEKHGLLAHTDIVLAQDAGSKAYCISQLVAKGYDPHKVLMCGDAPGDMKAAQVNGVYFFPILVHQESQSWDTFVKEGFNRLIIDTYGGEYQEMMTHRFVTNLGGKE